MDYPKVTYAQGISPVPALPSAMGSSHQDEFFMEPANPSVRGGAGKAQEGDQTFRAPGTFGQLTTTYTLPCGPDPAYGSVHRRFARRISSGVDRGLDRDEQEDYERAKYNPLRHARGDDYNNPEFLGEPVTGANKKVLGLAQYPYVQNAVMKAPYYPRAGAFSMPQATQPDMFTKVLSIRELHWLIIGHLHDRQGDLSNLSRTCQFAMNSVHQSFTYVDIRNGDFLGLHLQPTAEGDQDPARNCLTPFLMVAPVREEFTEQDLAMKDPLDKVEAQLESANDGLSSSMEEALKGSGFPAYKGKLPSPKSVDSISNFFRLIKLIHYRGSAFSHVMFHGIDWLDIRGLRALLNEMPRLESFVVSQCSLLDYASTGDILEYVVSRWILTKSSEPRIRFDFAPKYYHGLRKRNGQEYGLVSHDNGRIDTDRGLAASLIHLYSLSKKMDLDIFSPGKGFRVFLDMLPLRPYTLPAILKAIANLHDLNAGVHHSQVMASNVAGRHVAPTNEGLAPAVSPQMALAMNMTAWQDLIIAVNGKPMTKDTLERMLILRGCLALEKCVKCDQKMPSFFFQAEVAARSANHVVCHGCQLLHTMEEDTWAFRAQRLSIARNIWNQGTAPYIEPIGIPELTSSTELFQEKRNQAWEMAKQIDGSMTKAILKTILQKEKQIACYQEDPDQDLDTHVMAVSVNEDRISKLRKQVDSQYIQLGLRQSRLTTGTEQAASWEVRLREYREEWATQTGAIRQGRGPVMFAVSAKGLFGLGVRPDGIESWDGPTTSREVDEQVAEENQEGNSSSSASPEPDDGAVGQNEYGTSSSSVTPEPVPEAVLPHLRRGPAKKMPGDQKGTAEEAQRASSTTQWPSVWDGSPGNSFW
ncbi:hypothetical protein F4780DRAFT_71257 [Xylariomycetidae sp. FL0641]|nr:hypothetical protein F4780DRAFT_71257 [Xylariomycetidae sp. FL0641]